MYEQRCRMCRQMYFILIRRPPPSSTRTNTLFPYPALFRSRIPQLAPGFAQFALRLGQAAAQVVGGHLAFPFRAHRRSEEPTSELQSRMRNTYADFRLKKTKQQCYTPIHLNYSNTTQTNNNHHTLQTNSSIHPTPDFHY